MKEKPGAPQAAPGAPPRDTSKHKGGHAKPLQERAMPDPFLRVHLVDQMLFTSGCILSASGRLFPISIRDQMFRSCLLVDRAIEVGLIGEGRPLVVVGAGAGGVTAAIRAAERGVSTLLLEREWRPFTRQASSLRYVDPTQYDWPVSHWEAGAYPHHEEAAIPLPWEAGTARDLSRKWQQSLDALLLRLKGTLRIDYKTSVGSWETVERGLKGKASGPCLRFHASFHDMPRATAAGDARGDGFSRCEDPEHSNCHHFDCGMILVCVGAGMEICELDGHRSPHFWGAVDRLHCDPPMRNFEGSPRVLISGGGDGALQDFIRFTTGYASAGRFYRVLRDASHPARHALEKAERCIQSAEDQAYRLLQWSCSPQHDHEVLSWLDSMHRQALGELRREPGWKTLHEAVQDHVAGRGCRSIDLAFRCTHYAQSYALNRFLVLLLGECLRDSTRCNVRTLPEHEVTEIQPGPEDAASHPEGRLCYQRPHRFRFSVKRCGDPYGRRGAVPAKRVPHEDYDMFILRHGLDTAREVYGIPISSTMRCLLPYYPLPRMGDVRQGAGVS